MPKRLLVAAGFLLLLAVPGWLLFTPPPFPSKVFNSRGHGIKILGVTYGTNHVLSDPKWKSSIRRHFPKLSTKVFRPERKRDHQTANNSLVIWTELYEGKNPATTKHVMLKTYFPDGRISYPRVVVKGGIHVNEFRGFARDQSDLKMGLDYLKQDLVFTLKNPCRETKLLDFSRLPKTTNIGGTSFFFRESNQKYTKTLDWKSLQGHNRYWIMARGTLEDELGNWEQYDSYRNPLPRIMGTSGRTRLTFSLDEYIPAGFIDWPGIGFVKELPIPGRAGDFHIYQAICLGPGSFRIRDCKIEFMGEVEGKVSEAILVNRDEDPMDLQIASATASVLCFFIDGVPGMGRPTARIRERLPQERGSGIFSSRRPQFLQIGGNSVVGFYPISVPGYVSNLQVEIIRPFPSVTIMAVGAPM